MKTNHKLLSFKEINSKEQKCGLINLKENLILEIENFYNPTQTTGKEYNPDLVKILPPINPSKIICVGLNYHDHANELKMQIPEEPIIFLKPPSGLIGHNDKIILPPQSKRVDYEAELVIVIKSTTKNIEENQVEEYILGYTCGNDVTARDLQKKDGQWTRAKSFDTFAPIGPYITLSKDVNPNNLNIFAKKNGIVVQSSNTSQMIFNCQKLVSYISKIMTLFPGDIIMTGTPCGIGALKENDTIEIEIETLGTLKNIVSS